MKTHLPLIKGQQYAGGWIAAVLSALGAAIFLLWQPVTDYFVTGTYDDNIVLQIDPDSLKTANGQTLLGIRVRVANKGNVPFKLYDSGKEELTLEVREVGKIEKGEWVNSSEQLPVANRSVFKTNSGPISISSGSYWAKDFAVALPKGVYLIKAQLTKSDSSNINEEIFFELNK